MGVRKVSSKYYVDKTVENTIAIEKMAIGANLQVVSIFDKFLQLMKSTITNTYKHGNTWGAFQRIASPKDAQEYKKFINEVLKVLNANPSKYNNNELIFFSKELKRSYYSLYDIMYGTLRGYVTLTGNETIGNIRRNLPVQSSTAYKLALYTLQVGTGVAVPFTLPTDTEWLKRLLASTVNGVTYEDRVEANTADMVNTMETILKDNLIGGSKEDKVLNDLALAYLGNGSNQSYYKDYERLYRTETDSGLVIGMFAGYKDSGYVSYGTYVAILDMVTSEICKGLNGTTLPLNKFVRGINCPPMHVNCRSSIAPVINYEQAEILLNNEGNKYVEVGTTYAEWEKLFT